MKTKTPAASPATKPTSASRPPVGAGADKINLFFVELDGPKGGISATYNPKQITIDKSIPWATHDSKKNDSPSLEFTKADARTMSLELFFDTYESGVSVYTECIAILELGTAVMEGKTGKERRPPTCVVSWSSGFPRFVGVIESLSVAYTMFFSNGTPCRATVTLKLKEPQKPKSDGALAAFSAQSPRDREAAYENYMERAETRAPRPPKPAASPATPAGPVKLPPSFLLE